VKRPVILTWQCVLLLACITFAGCGTRNSGPDEARSLTPARATAVEDGVRSFMGTVAHDVTQDGPTAWRRHFSDSPAFFMASEGRLAFPNSAAAMAGIQDFARTIKQMELRWGDDLRVDPLAPDLAVVAVQYHEIRVDTVGRRVDENGFFTGTAEYRNGRWQFRNAHWSVAAPPPTVR
jgi:hypothetical protein